MGPKKSRRVRKIEVPTDTFPEFELETLRQIFYESRRRGRQERGRRQARTSGLSSNHHRPLLQPPPPHSKNINSHQPSCSLSLLSGQPTPNSSSSRTPAKPPISPFSGPLLFKHLKFLFRTTQIFQKQLIATVLKKFPNKKHYTAHTKHFVPQKVSK